eukprot:3810169-Pyramimonas_sp.AAC.2
MSAQMAAAVSESRAARSSPLKPSSVLTFFRVPWAEYMCESEQAPPRQLVEDRAASSGKSATGGGWPASGSCMEALVSCSGEPTSRCLDRSW